MGKRTIHDEFEAQLERTRHGFRRKVYNLFFSAIILMNIAGWLYIGYKAGQHEGIKELQMQAIDLDLAEFDPKTATWGFLSVEQVYLRYTQNGIAASVPPSSGAVPVSAGMELYEQEVQDESVSRQHTGKKKRP